MTKNIDVCINIKKLGVRINIWIEIYSEPIKKL